MNRKLFNFHVKHFLNDIKEGYYGEAEMFDEIWGWINELQKENKSLNKKLAKLQK